MSISFNQPLSEEGQRLLNELFGKPKASDGRSFLYDDIVEINQKDMKELANKAQQPATVELHGEGKIKTMADGTQYQVTRRGWVKVGG
jgi:hypothetical protein